MKKVLLYDRRDTLHAKRMNHAYCDIILFLFSAPSLFMNIVILAAGQGKRMCSSLPKVLHTIAGKPMLLHVLETAQQLKPSKLVVVLGHQAEKIKAVLPANVMIAHQDPPLGTGHALQQAYPYLDNNQPTLVLYGDVPLISLSTLEKMCVSHQQSHHKSLVLLTQNLENPTGYGRIIRNTQQEITAIVEEKDADDTTKQIREVNTGFMLLPASPLGGWLEQLSDDNAQKEYYLTDMVAFAAQDQIEISTISPQYNWECQGVNNRAQQAYLERSYQLHLAKTLMDQGVSLLDPNRIDIRGSLSCEEDVEIDVNCIFMGQVSLAKGVRIEANCVLKDVSVGSHSIIKSFSHLEKAQVEDHVQIGPYARIRPDTHIGSHAHVGNFVEMKKTFFGAYSKANHLAYVGDAIVGKNVNIGAGAITCNYDGAHKYQTIIGDGAFIGSDSQLVAPVKVGEGATIGAGTTLTKDAPEHQLTLSRAKQTTISGWKKPEK
jgi:bifunctional UDP-N-acetylglucosamine pyrophosphorylase/glucosamine-1-phosphate N-acetyltransferase